MILMNVVVLYYVFLELDKFFQRRKENVGKKRIYRKNTFTKQKVRRGDDLEFVMVNSNRIRD